MAVPITILPAFCVRTSTGEETNEETFTIPTNNNFRVNDKLDTRLLNERELASDSGQGGSDDELQDSKRPPIISFVQRKLS